jgi:uncharacterized membrane protein (DUF373 family)
MEDHEISAQGVQSIQEHHNDLPPPLTRKLNRHAAHAHEDRLAFLSSLLLDRADTFIYGIVGICFLLGALFALGYSIWDFVLNITAQHPDAVNAIIKFVSDLLLVLIIMEVLGTVTHYLKAHATSLRPFLFIGIVSATRGILSIGARLSVGEVRPEDFAHTMIELGVNAMVILALGITLKLLEKHFEDAAPV